MVKMLVIVLVTQSCVYAQSIEKLTVEPNHSTIGFSISIGGGLTRVTGKFLDYDMKFSYADKDLTRSQVVFIIKASSIDTGNEERDDHLRNEEFFDVTKYPEIIFRSTRIKKKGKNFLLEGQLEMHGVTKTLALPLKRIANTETGLQAFEIRFPINRKEYGVGNSFKHTIMENFLPDEIDMEINLWTKKDKR
jgi:polyisoprenoid-binding protein YceI